MQPKNNGSALITALFIMALVASVAVLLSLQQLLAIRSTTQLINADQAALYATGVTAWAHGVLYRNAAESEGEIILDKLPQKLNLRRNNAVIVGNLNDMQARFNLNNLTKQEAIETFVHLLQQVDPDLEASEAQDIALATHAWVASVATSANNPQAIKIPDYDKSVYKNHQPAYQAPHQLMASPSEWRWVAGVTTALYQKLQPYITTLPESTKVNLNTAAAPVIAALTGITLTDAESIVSDRQDKPFKSLEDFNRHSLMREKKLNGDWFTVSSEFFLVKADVRIAKQRYTQYSLLKREKSVENGKVTVKIAPLWQSVGTW